MGNPIKFIVVAVKWFDKVYGNTYFSIRVIRCRDREVIVAPFQYGYGDQYRYAAWHLMIENGWIPKKYEKQVYLYECENRYPIFYTCRYGTKKECKANGEEL